MKRTDSTCKWMNEKYNQLTPYHTPSSIFLPFLLSYSIPHLFPLILILPPFILIPHSPLPLLPFLPPLPPLPFLPLLPPLPFLPALPLACSPGRTSRAATPDAARQVDRCSALLATLMSRGRVERCLTHTSRCCTAVTVAPEGGRRCTEPPKEPEKKILMITMMTCFLQSLSQLEEKNLNDGMKMRGRRRMQTVH